jgi:hypothetical protein
MMLKRNNAATSIIRAWRQNDNMIRNTPGDWLPLLKTDSTMCLTPKPEFRHVLEKIREVRLAA